jgi:hypothetical protein
MGGSAKRAMSFAAPMSAREVQATTKGDSRDFEYEIGGTVILKNGETNDLLLRNVELDDVRNVLFCQVGGRYGQKLTPKQAVAFRAPLDEGFPASDEVMVYKTKDGFYKPLGKSRTAQIEAGQEVMLEFSEQKAVTVVATAGSQTSRRTGYSFGGGNLITRTETTNKTTYDVRNPLAEEFEVKIDHGRLLHNSTLTVAGGSYAEIPGSNECRVTCKVSASKPGSTKKKTVTVTETVVQKQTISLVDQHNAFAYVEQVRSKGSKLEDNVEFAAAVSLYEQVKAKQKELKDGQTKATANQRQYKLVMERLNAPGYEKIAEDSVRARDLANAITEWESNTEPALQAAIAELSEKVREALSRVTFEDGDVS